MNPAEFKAYAIEGATIVGPTLHFDHLAGAISEDV